MKRILNIIGTTFVALAVSFGCAPTQKIRLFHTLVSHEDSVPRFMALRRSLLVLYKPSEPATDMNKSAPMMVTRAEDLAVEFQKQMSHLQIDPVVFLSPSEQTQLDLFKRRINPTGILTIDFTPETLESKEENFEGRTSTFNSQSPICRVRQVDATSGNTLLTFEVDPFPEDPLGAMTLASFTSKLAGVIFTRLLSAEEIETERPLFCDYSDPDSLRAFDAGMNGDWKTAKNIWQVRVETGKEVWKDAFNLGVAAEKSRDYPRAWQWYELARQSSQGVPEAQAIDWDLIDDHLSKSISMGELTDQREEFWFQGALAVLPIKTSPGDEALANVIRGVLMDLLRFGGYDVWPADKVDSILIKNGLLKNHKLKLIKPASLSKKMGVSKLLFGKVEIFSKPSKNNLQEKGVAGSFSMWEEKEKSWVWSLDQTISNMPTSTEIPTHEVPLRNNEDSVSRWERLEKHPHGPQYLQLLQRILETLPRRVAIQ